MISKDFIFKGFPCGSECKESTHNAGDLSSIPVSGRSPSEENGNPLQYSCLENPKDGGVWQATVHRVTKSQTQLSDLTFPFIFKGNRNHDLVYSAKIKYKPKI